MDHLAIIQGKDICIVQWCKDQKSADHWIAKWMRDNRETRPEIRATVAKCLFTIEG